MRLRYLITLLYIALMLGVAELTGKEEWIFPEVAALCTVMWVIDKSVWHISRWRLFFMLIIMASVGTSVQLYSIFPFTVNVCLVFIVAALVLTLFRSTSYPIISAGILPIVIEHGSWLYPVIVAVLAVGICIGQRLMECTHVRQAHRFLPTADKWQDVLYRWLPLLFIVLVVSAISEISHYRLIVVPPLIVTLVEFTAVGSGIRKQPLVILLLILCAALLGTGAQWAHQTGHISCTVCYVIALALLFVIFECCGRRFAPATAILLIPSIIPKDSLFLFPVYVTVGAALFILISMTLYKNDKLRWKN